jgi:hypothetical protein
MIQMKMQIPSLQNKTNNLADLITQRNLFFVNKILHFYTQEAAAGDLGYPRPGKEFFDASEKRSLIFNLGHGGEDAPHCEAAQ